MELLSVKDFADATGRFPNQIYDLINKGNQFRRLKHAKVDGVIKVFESEIRKFPFNSADKLRIELEERIIALEKRIEAIEEDMY